MQVTINGSSYSIEDNSSIKNLIEHLSIDGKYAIEVNQNIIPKSQYSKIKINLGDKIEIVKAIGGG